MRRVSKIVAVLADRADVRHGRVSGLGRRRGRCAEPEPEPGPNPQTGTLAWSVRPTPSAAAPDRPHFSFDVKPGGVITDSIRVRNFGAAALTFRIYASDAFTTKSGAWTCSRRIKQPKDVGAWISMGIDTIVVGAACRARRPVPPGRAEGPRRPVTTQAAS